MHSALCPALPHKPTQKEQKARGRSMVLSAHGLFISIRNVASLQQHDFIPPTEGTELKQSDRVQRQFISVPARAKPQNRNRHRRRHLRPKPAGPLEAGYARAYICFAPVPRFCFRFHTLLLSFGGEHNTAVSLLSSLSHAHTHMAARNKKGRHMQPHSWPA